MIRHTVQVFASERLAARERELEDRKKILVAGKNAECRTVYTWGDGGKGQLGHDHLYTVENFKKQAGTKATSNQAKEKAYTAVGRPRKVMSLLPRDGVSEHEYGNLVKIFARGCNCAAITNRGGLLTWGDNSFGQLGQGKTNWGTGSPALVKDWLEGEQETIIDVAVSYYTMAVLTGNGRVYTWGRGDLGCLGYGLDEDGDHQRGMENKPRLCERISSRGIQMLAAGDQHFLARTELGQVYAWGNGGSGRLGLGREEDEKDDRIVDVPEVVKYFEKNGVAAGMLAAGGAHTVIVSQQFPADDVAGKPLFSSLMEIPLEEVPWSFSNLECCMIQ